MSTPLLEVDRLAISFAHPRPAVDEISLSLAPGEIVALVGESGSGKSMTARAVLGLLPEGARTSGSIRFRGEELLEGTDRDFDRFRGARIAMVFQEPQTALNPVRSIGWQLRQALRAHGRPGSAEVRERSLELLRQVEIPEPALRLKQYPHQLSGGQRQRVVIALALAGDPDLLLADEPTTALDVTVQHEILLLLERIRQDLGTTVLLITHDMGVVAQVADRMIVLRRGRVVEQGPTQRLFATPRHPYTRQLLDAVLRLPQTGDGAPAPAPAPALVSGGSDGPLLRLESVRVAYGSSRRGRMFPALDGVSLEVRRGEVIGLVGESGSGKTTLGRLAAGLVPLADGRVEFAGRSWGDLGGRDLRAARRHLAFVHQDPQASLDPRLTVAAAIREPLDVHRIGTPRDRERRVAELLESVALTSSYAGRRPHELSGGERQRVAVARALALGPRLVVADEPTSALDVSVQAEVLDLFERLQAQLGFACLFISHDLAVVNRVAHRVAVLKAGRLVELATTEELFANPRADYTRALLSAVPAPDPRLREGARRTDLEQIA